MPTQTLLVAGPCHLDDLTQQEGLIGGAGAYAAIAAAALTPCQLWARTGDGFSKHCEQILERRRVDTAGLINEGDCNRYSDGKMHCNGPALPSLSPHDAQNVGATLCIDLPHNEAKRAWQALNSLKGANKRIAIQAPGHNCNSIEELNAWAAEADLLVIDYHKISTLLNQDDPLELMNRIQDMDCESIVMCNGNFGGLIQYKNKTSGFLAIPSNSKDPTGSFSSFVGVLSGSLCSQGKLDFRGLKRATATASAVASSCAQGIGPKKLLELGRNEYQQLYNKLRRTSKF